MKKIDFYISIIKYYFYALRHKLFKYNTKQKSKYNGKSILKDLDGQLCIYNRLSLAKPCMIGRFGAVELLLINHYLRIKNHISLDYSKNIREQAKYCAGIFPNDNKTLNKVAEIYLNAIKDLDILAVWNFEDIEEYLVKYYTKNINLIDLDSISSWKHNQFPWTKYLENKKVLVIHPFKKSIEKQYKNRDKLFINKDILPEFKELIVLKAVQSIGGSTEFDDWVEALEYMKSEIDKIDFDIALIGAGAYGLPLASYIKKKGKQAIHYGGSLQMLFGIAGKRWKINGDLDKLQNEFWIYPSDDEKPYTYKKTEGGCYW